MNNRGFTLVELIATIALLAIVSIISFVSINAVVDKSKISECSGNDKKYRFNVSVLMDKKKLSSSVINPFDDDEDTNNVTSTTFVEVSLNNNYTVKKVIVKNSLGNEVDCEAKKW